MMFIGSSVDLDRMLETMSGNRIGSRLDPYRDEILRWRRRGHSYRKIQRVLLEQCGIRIAYDPLRRYVLRRSRVRKEEREAEPQVPGDRHPSSSGLSERQDDRAASPLANASADRWAAERE